MVRRRSTSRLKTQVVEEVLAGDKTPEQIARAHGMRPDSVGPGKRRFIERAPEIFAEETTASRSVVSGIRNSCWARGKWRSRFQKIARAGTTERGGESDAVPRGARQPAWQARSTGSSPICSGVPRSRGRTTSGVRTSRISL